MEFIALYRLDRASVSYINNHNIVEFNVGGDCTNAACVPSKSIRSIAKLAASNHDDRMNGKNEHGGMQWLRLARLQADEAVGKVRAAREDPSLSIHL